VGGHGEHEIRAAIGGERRVDTLCCITADHERSGHSSSGERHHDSY